MEKIKKDYKLKLIAILLFTIFIYSDLLYPYPYAENHCLLRPPTMGEYNRVEETIKSRDSGNLSSNVNLNRRDFLSAVAFPLVAPFGHDQDIIQNWRDDEDKANLSLTISRDMPIEKVILNLAKDSMPYMQVRLTKSQIRVLSAQFKNQNPALGRVNFLKKGTSIDATDLYNELLVLDILGRSDVIASYAFSIRDTKITVYFVNKSRAPHLSQGAVTVSTLDKEYIFIDVGEHKENAKKTFKAIHKPRNAREKFLAEECLGWPTEKIFIEKMKENLFHEIIHAITLKGIKSGKFNSTLLTSEVIRDELEQVRRSAGEKKIYRIKEELAAIFGQLSYSTNARVTLELMVVASIGGVQGSLDYASTGRCVNSFIFDELGFIRYLMKQGINTQAESYREWAAEADPPQRYGQVLGFIKSLHNTEINKAAQHYYERFFGPLPSKEVVLIPGEVVGLHKVLVPVFLYKEGLLNSSL